MLQASLIQGSLFLYTLARESNQWPVGVVNFLKNQLNHFRQVGTCVKAEEIHRMGFIFSERAEFFWYYMTDIPPAKIENQQLQVPADGHSS